VRIILSILLLIFSSGCIEVPKTGEPEHQFDPRIPGGRIGGTKIVLPVDGLTADTSQLERVKLQWEIPSLYHTLPYVVNIYRRTGNSSFILPNPGNEASGAELYKIKELRQTDCEDGHCKSWINGLGGDGTIVQGLSYQYWVYVFIDGVWSSESFVQVTSRVDETTLKIPTGTSFWENTKFNMGFAPISGFPSSPTGNSISTLNPKVSDEACILNFDQNSCSKRTGCSWNPILNECHQEPQIGRPKSDLEFGYNGGILYVADTDNNRVVVYIKNHVVACEPYKDDNELYQACMFSFSGGPYDAVNVLGQPNQYSTLPCKPECLQISNQASCGSTAGCSWNPRSCGIGQSELDCTLSPAGSCSPIQPLNSCMTKPSAVYVSGGKLFVSDSGNDRVLMWDHIVGDPSRGDAGGCDPNITISIEKTPDCAATMQIGKKSLNDFSSYSLITDGSKILKNPTGLVEKNGDLYVADTGHHRVVKVSQFLDPQIFSCSEANWNTSKCKFSAVIGQPSFEVSKTFNDLVNEDDQKKISCSQLSNPSPNQGVPGSEALCVASTGCSWTPLVLPGQGTCAYSNSIFDQSDIGSLLSTQNENILRRYFANPTTLKITDDNKLLILSNENYTRPSVVGNPISLKSRILVFNIDPLAGDSPRCSLGSFSSGSCDADDVIGQLEFRRLISLQSSTSKYSDVFYGLEQVTDFDLVGNIMIAVDSKNNLVYLWNNWKNQIPGHPADDKIVDPEGRKNPLSSGNLPNLVDISAIEINKSSFMIYISDPSKSKVYEIQAF
jgi:hypothetical protein